MAIDRIVKCLRVMMKGRLYVVEVICKKILKRGDCMKDTKLFKIGDIVYIRDTDRNKGYASGEIVSKEEKEDRVIYKIVANKGAEEEEYYSRTNDLCGDKKQEVFESEEEILTEFEKEMAAIRVITASPYIDWDIMEKYQATNIYMYFQNPVRRLEKLEKILLEVLQLQFAMLELEKIYAVHGEKNCIEFLNRAIAFQMKKTTRKERIELSPETVKEFLLFANEEGIPVSDEPLTIRKFLKMCRVVYDAAEITATEYPLGASDTFIYCGERALSFQEDFRGFIEKDWDSPQTFRKFALYRYHPEELQFGGMCVYLQFYDADWWTGSFYVRSVTSREARQAILAYVALRKNGYPITITCDEAEELLKCAERY